MPSDAALEAARVTLREFYIPGHEAVDEAVATALDAFAARERERWADLVTKHQTDALDEREACALLVEGYEQDRSKMQTAGAFVTRHELAAAIRGRK